MRIWHTLAPPLVVLGLATEFVAGGGERRHAAPFDVPAQDAGWVPRRELALAVAELLRVGRGTTVAFTTGLQGAGGFGKTMLAREVARHPDVRRRYRGGVVRTTVGRDQRGVDLARADRDADRQARRCPGADQ
ncbi:hypothetical protein E1293_10765 [Actinomadura darangshiensis]|uniref:Uncharacterized protein n=1 Tax=Actinomadura darangshiensis TaxID=705336 RepID=A0A4R5BNN3_9ACTN|nr:hypothetical protein [Actinomadura darangshiensis]TDD85582.1 hypothetical protein E1293_10765 [Actinomadura darangshiensis]